MDSMENPAGFGLTADVEDSYLIRDAARCYRAAADSGTIFCAHASCERDLAVTIQMSGAKPQGSDRWGLGRIVDHLARDGVLPQDLAVELRTLNDHRKTLYHHGHSTSDTALTGRTSKYIYRVGSDSLRQQFEQEHAFKGSNGEV
ncbi:hypothetical protein E5720_06945 [Rhodococcus sp. PAMC28707]|uniref:hypothetical protein n=1 Tax=unclassified Rhodococcus (in: high G+C Gram-positive bacteria) TaxID=192944 RepID=UPI00109E2FDC|nr:MULTISPECIES: hypothetical protein [unclassified Rhodococcus (in: high G+C Gram-positive bacteria)]QCB50020.1 hypothetical protein E5769_07070 [Rhodococcus sp. PAMC28705]QCB58285.1 hypothetical protein E5720_06945 [Rhodococcus sp. PAMC28707]